MSNSRMLLTVAGASALAAVAAGLIVVAVSPRDEKQSSVAERVTVAPTPSPTPTLDMSRLEEVAAMEPLERCKFDLAVDLAPDATYTWEEICAVHEFITSEDYLDAIGSPGGDLSYGWRLDAATGRLHFDVSEPYVEESREAMERFGELVEVTEGPLMVG